METKAGILPMSLNIIKDQIEVNFKAPQIDLVESPWSLETLLEVTDIAKEKVTEKTPLSFEKTK